MQELQITLRFKVLHKPENNEAHLRVVAKNYFGSKGITLQDNIIEI